MSPPLSTADLGRFTRREAAPPTDWAAPTGMSRREDTPRGAVPAFGGSAADGGGVPPTAVRRTASAFWGLLSESHPIFILLLVEVGGHQDVNRCSTQGLVNRSS